MADNFNILDSVGATKTMRATDVGSGILAQHVNIPGLTRQETFTTATDGEWQDVSAQTMGHFALQCVETGSVTSWTIELQISLDGTNPRTILTHTKAGSGNTEILSTGANYYVANYFRIKCSAINTTGGTNVVATAVGK